MGKQLYKPIKIPARLGFLSYLGDTQGCGTIRVIHPFLLLNHYRQKGIQVVSQTMNHYCFDVNFYKQFTFCQFQRSSTEHHFKLLVHFKTQVQSKYNVPIVYEIDDMLLGIPDYNYATNYYTKNEDWVKKCMQISDCMVVSTDHLKTVYSEYNKNITVVENHLPKFIWGDIYPAHEYKDEKEKIKILWSGSQNHFSNKMLTPKAKGGDFGQELLSFIRKTTDIYDWYLVGSMPEELNNIKNQICFVPWKHIFEYPRAVKEIEPDICIAPLEDNPFNACKSNIKQLEYTALGAAGVYSDVLPYKKAKIKVKTDEEMVSEIERLAGDIDARRKTFKSDLAAVRGQLWWEEFENVKKYINSYLGLFKQRL
jgi:hypothetical protein